MSDRTYQKFKKELYELFYDYLYDYEQFRVRAEKLIVLAYKHREISGLEFMKLKDMYGNMCACLEFSFLEE